MVTLIDTRPVGTQGPRGQQGEQGIQGLQGPQGLDIPRLFNVMDFGARGDNSHDDTQAIHDALEAALFGGTVLFPAGVYKISTPIGLWGAEWEFEPEDLPLPVDKIKIIGLAGQYATRIVTTGNFPAFAGIFNYCHISDLTIDGNEQSAVGMDLHLDHTTLHRVSVINWGSDNPWMEWPVSACGMRINKGTYVPVSDLGLLNVISECHIDLPVAGKYGLGIDKGYRCSDSWIMNCNIGSTEANIRLEGGPMRIIGCHLNGRDDTRRPRHNILILGGLRFLITHNILEACKEEAIKFVAEEWMTDYDQQWQIIGNAFSNGGQDLGYPAISITGTSSHDFKGFMVNNNLFANEEAEWTNAVAFTYCDEFQLVGNTWYSGIDGDPVLVDSCGSNYEIGLNGNRNGVTVI